MIPRGGPLVGKRSQIDLEAEVKLLCLSGCHLQKAVFFILLGLVAKTFLSWARPRYRDAGHENSKETSSSIFFNLSALRQRNQKTHRTITGRFGFVFVVTIVMSLFPKSSVVRKSEKALCFQIPPV